MGRFKLSNNLVKIILGLCLVFVLWSLWSNMGFLDSVDDTAASKNLPVLTDEAGQIKAATSDIKSNIAMSGIKKINNSTDMLSLVVGANFSLETDFNGESKTILLSAFDVAQNSKFTQIQGKGANGNVAVITLTPTLTNILLKTSDNIFEYTGNDFKGILNQVARLNLSDDIYIRKSKAKPITDDFKPKKIPEK
ncbi:MAG: hypothetical protein HN620_08460 [Porticoccaceae bacterium]|jgi:hypothetical protein|nr:hypothetical protein [Porticoccaceae bacterium]